MVFLNSGLSKSIFFKISWYLIAFSILFCGLVLQLNNILNHDVSWLLYLSEQWLAGKQLYVDFYESNPPLIIYIYAIPAVVSNFIPIEAMNVLRIFVALLSLFCAVLGRKILLINSKPFDRIFAFVLPLLFLFLVMVMTTYDYAQREHLVIAFLFPSLFLYYKRFNGVEKFSIGLMVVVGILAGLAYSIKPSYLPILVALELIYIFKTRDVRQLIRLELLVTLTVGIGYVLSVFIFVPAFFENSVPLSMDTYWVYFRPWDYFFRKSGGITYIFIITLLSVLISLDISKKQFNNLAVIFIVVVLGSYLAYLLGRTPWGYHLIPLWVSKYLLLLILIGLVIIRFFKGDLNYFKFLQLIFLFTLTNYMFHYEGYKNISIKFSKKSIDIATSELLRTEQLLYLDQENIINKHFFQLSNKIKAYTKLDKNFYYIGVRMSPAWPLVSYLNLTWSSRFHVPWPVPALVAWENGLTERKIQTEHLKEIHQYFFDSLIEDFQKFNPGLVVVNATAGRQYDFMGFNMPKDFDFIKYFLTDIRFQKIWSKYRKIDSMIFLGQKFEFYQLQEW